LSKRLTHLPGEEPPADPQRGARLLALRPKRAVETWKLDSDTGLVVVTHVKAVGAVEARLIRLLRGSPTVNRRLDEYGSAIWLMCDGSRTVEEIARALDEKFRERFEPALPRTLKFVGLLAERRLVTIERSDDGPAAGGAA
jgi:hypothetical protein